MQTISSKSSAVDNAVDTKDQGSNMPVSNSELRANDDEKIKSLIKPLSQNAFFAFFQRLIRAWLTRWYGFSDRHPKASKLLYQFVFVFLFSNAVTIVQYLVTLFLPMVMGLELAGTEFMWPAIPMYSINGVQKYWTLLGYDIVRNSAGEVIIGGGLGYFIAFEIATFLAQCINFPLQRNITFKSHGNPVFQAMWYFIGWISVSLVCNGLNSLWLPLGAEYLPFAVYNILTMISMGGVSIVLFFFIFLVIFPDYNATEKRLRTKVERMKKRGMSGAKLEKLEAKLSEVAHNAKLANTEKDESKKTAQASAKALRYFAVLKNVEKDKEKGVTQSDIDKKIEKAFNDALNAIKLKEEATEARKAALT